MKLSCLRCHRRRRLVLLVLFGCSVAYFAVYRPHLISTYSLTSIAKTDIHTGAAIASPFNANRAADDDDKLNVSRYDASSRECVRPRLELWPTTQLFRDAYRRAPPQDCVNSSRYGGDWVAVRPDRHGRASLIIDGHVTARHGHVTCLSTTISRGSGDFHKIVRAKTSKILLSESIMESELIEVKCSAADGQNYSDIHLAVLRNETVVRRSQQLSANLPSTSRQIDIIMFGFDTVSRLVWMRMLPKSYSYLVKELGAVVLEGYNIVGDGTTQALLPMLTGRTEVELPESRHGFKGAKCVDGHPWIWTRLQDIGYVTQFGEQSPHMGAFTYRLKGFRQQPVDEYLRTFYKAARQYDLRDGDRIGCRGSLNSHTVMLQWFKDFLVAYVDRPKFAFNFHSEYSHGSSTRLVWADDDLRDFLVWLKETGRLDNALLVMMSDHGPRFQKMRATEQGKYEERLPFVAVRPPTWFSDKYPSALENLRTNSGRLTTPFDIHETFNDIVNMATSRPLSGTQDSGHTRRTRRGISLFDVIPADRTCSEADIEPHWCTCLSWNPVSADSPEVAGAIDAVLVAINNITKFRDDVCARLTLWNVTSAFRYISGGELLKFKRSYDHGRVPDLNGTMKAGMEYYQVTFSVSPSGALYETTVKYRPADDVKFTVALSDVSRINRYGDQPHCVASQFPHLRQYCYCTSNPQS